MDQRISVLLVDDEESFRNILKEELALMGFNMKTVPNGEEAKKIITQENFDIILLDIKLPGMDGIATLKVIKELSPLSEVIMLTAYATVENAISSMKLGAYDYLTKPCKLEELEAVIHKAYEKKHLVQQNIKLKQELARRDRHNTFIGESPKIKTILELISKVANTDSTVLIQGESGVGKELVANLIHKNSLRKDHPFVVIDCGTLPEELMENELFGHERGAYTSAIGFKHGLLEVADTGTLFLDEIGDISPIIQQKLLRVLETRTFRRVGGTKDIKVDIRLIAATNKDLQKLVAEGNFREDLFYRLNVFPITVPPLRERKEDIPLLAKHFLRNTTITGKDKKEISDEAMELLLKYHWPGNVRELQNVIERAIILSDDQCITPKDLPLTLKVEPERSKENGGATNNIRSLQDLEKNYILKVLEECGGNRVKAARAMNLSERTLYRKLKKHHIHP
jgi:DNA-binding NtrC family response regulator